MAEPYKPPAPAWRRIARLQFWLLLLPPIGWWKLSQDTTFNRTAKIRILVYTYLVPLVAYILMILYVLNATQQAIQTSGGGF